MINLALRVSSAFILFTMKNVFALKSVIRRSESVVGAVTNREVGFLYHLAKRGPGDGTVVEIGSFLGRSTIFLASGSKSGGRGKIYSIDPHKGAFAIGRRFSGPTYQQYLKNLSTSKVKGSVISIRSLSTEAIKKWNKPIRLLFIDGNHTYAAVKADILHWEPFLVQGGVIVMHDALNPAVGPSKAIVKLLLNNQRFSHLGVVDGIFYCSKKPTSNFTSYTNWWFFYLSMNLVARLLQLKKSSTPSKLRVFVRQYLVKRWIKRVLTVVTSSFGKYSYMSRP